MTGVCLMAGFVLYYILITIKVSHTSTPVY